MAQTGRGEPSLLAGLRVGIHKGPALAATLDDQLDYFGTTVRDVVGILSQARDGDLLLTQAVAADLEVAALLHERGARTEIVPTAVPGHRHLIRVRLETPGAGAPV
jgi:class 3 adenylate cyclase